MIIFQGTSFPLWKSVKNFIRSQGLIVLNSLQMSCDTSEKNLAKQLEAIIEDAILSKPWVAKIWVLQKFVFSVNSFIQLGMTHLRWNIICNYVLWSNFSFWLPASRKLLTGMKDARFRLKILSSESQ